MSTNSFDFSTCFSQAWETYKKNMLLLIGVTLVSSILIVATIGILNGPITAGLMLLIFKLLDNDSSAKFEDLFNQFDTFKTTLLLSLAWGGASLIISLILSSIPIIGNLASFVISIVISLFLIFSILLAAEKKLEFKEASLGAIEIIKANPWPLLGFTAVALVLSYIGFLACGIGVVVTAPFFYVMMACAYRSCTTGTPDEMIEIPSSPAPAPAPEAAPAEAPVEAPEAEPKKVDDDEFIDITEPENKD